jgi:hypothetical protein
MIKDHCQLDGNQKTMHFNSVQILYLVQGIKMLFRWFCTLQVVSRLHSHLLQKNNINEKETLHTKLINLVFEPFILWGCYAVYVCTCLLPFWNHGSSMNSWMEYFVLTQHFSLRRKVPVLRFPDRKGIGKLGNVCKKKM